MLGSYASLIQTKVTIMTIAKTDLGQHNSRKSCWIAIHDTVYDVTGRNHHKNLLGQNSFQQNFLTITLAEQVLSYATLARMPQKDSILCIHQMFWKSYLKLRYEVTSMPPSWAPAKMLIRLV